MRRLPVRARLLTLVVIVTNVAGNALLSAGMNSGGSVLAALLTPAALAGVALLIVWTLTRITLMSWADLSYILPVTASGYILTTAAAAILLREHVSLTRWIASALIFAGIVLAGATDPQTARNSDQC